MACYGMLCSSADLEFASINQGLLMYLLQCELGIACASTEMQNVIQIHQQTLIYSPIFLELWTSMEFQLWDPVRSAEFTSINRGFLMSPNP